METRASTMAVGLFVLLLALGAAFTAVWLAAVGSDDAEDVYAVAFAGSVQGLQEGSAVLYRGIPVGRVENIRIDEDNVNRVLAEIGVDEGTPVKTDTRAELVLQGVTGLVNIELTGGSNETPLLLEASEVDPPVIEADRSTIEQVFDSTPELLLQSSVLLARAERLLSPGNLESVESALANLATLSTALADNSGDIEALITDGAGAAAEFKEAAEGLDGTLREVESLVGALSNLAEGLDGQVETTVTEVQGAATAARNLVFRADRVLGNLEQPLDDFGQSGLYDITRLTAELRQLVATLSRISTEFERNPAGFLIGGGSQGFDPGE